MYLKHNIKNIRNLKSLTTSTFKNRNLYAQYKAFSSNHDIIIPNILPTNRNQYEQNQTPGPYGKYNTEYQNSIQNPEQFWKKASSSLHWFNEPQTILHKKDEYFYEWFPDGSMNTCYNALDVHCEEGRGGQCALIYDSPVTNTKQKMSYKELLHDVSVLAGGLANLNVKKGDRVVIYMPMIPQAVIAMLACTRIGAIHSVVFGGFASKELASRIDDCKPKLIISASSGVEAGGRIVEYKPLLNEALKMCEHEVEKCVIYQRKNVISVDLDRRDVDYEELMNQSTPHDAIPMKSTDTHYILYTSGTTGKPKGVVRDVGGYATALKWSMSHFYDNKPGDTFWAASDLGWVVGHSYIVYAPLLQGCTTVLYEGKPVGTPDAGAFWRVMDEYRVNTLFTAPTAFRAIKQADPEGLFVPKYDLSAFQALFLAGERSDPDTLHWCERVLNKGDQSTNVIPAIDHWWQTELGWPGAGNALGLGKFPTKYGACSAPVPGYDIKVFDDHGELADSGTLGNITIKLPLPPGTLPTLYNNDERYMKEYLVQHPGYYTTGDEGIIDEEGYIHILGRTDDVINTAGHRLSTGSMEEILLHHPYVADCAVIGVKDEIKGEVPIGFVTTTKGWDENIVPESQICEELVQAVRNELGPVASFKKVRIVQSLPKTRSGKILRGTMKKIANGEAYVITPTIEDPLIFDTLGPQIVELVKG